mmetsp:Transcript_30325/g.93817  ORF Transcript_30325/g.93817 Transcript_30325/m.93817 type:complete len:216 (+) Transcript_30325:2670-3317(+)
MPDLHTARALTMLIDEWLTLGWAFGIRQALYARVDYKIFAALVTMQSCARVGIARKRLKVHWREHALVIRKCLEYTACAAIQKRLARGPAAREAVSECAVQVYKKYSVDHDELAQYDLLPNHKLVDHSSKSTDIQQACAFYWAFIDPRRQDSAARWSARASRVAWTKPKILRRYDVVGVSQRPNKRTAFVVDCAFCGINAAERLCLGACADPYMH